jgi:hypothetical protein
MNLSSAMIASRVSGKYLAMLGSQPARTRQFFGDLIRFIASYNDIAVNPPHLPTRVLHEILPGVNDKEISLSHRFEPWTLPYGEAYVLAAVIAYLRPRKIFEIGTFTGKSTLLMAQQAGPDCQIYTLDLPPGRSNYDHRIGESFKGTEYEKQITQLFGNSNTFDFTPYAGQMDLVFVDAAHDYANVKNDTHKAFEMVSPSGTILWDDCWPRYPGVARALNEFGGSRPIYRIDSTRFAFYVRGTPSAAVQMAVTTGNGYGRR